jgi:hypothetical protein
MHYEKTLYSVYSTMNGKVSSLLLRLTPLRMMCGCVLIQGKIIKFTQGKIECVVVMWK